MKRGLSLLTFSGCILYFSLITSGCGKSASELLSSGNCSSNNQCSKTEICLDSLCKTALNRVYKVLVKDASLNRTSNSIDLDNSNPDPFVEIFFPDLNHSMGITSYVSDTLFPTWNQYAEVTVTADGQSLWFCMWNKDTLSNDPLYFSGTSNCMGFNNILDFIRAGDATVAGPGTAADVNYLNVSISAK